MGAIVRGGHPGSSLLSTRPTSGNSLKATTFETLIGLLAATGTRGDEAKALITVDDSAAATLTRSLPPGQLLPVDLEQQASNTDTVLALVRDIAGLDIAAFDKDDGLVYAAGGATAEVIRDEVEYFGVRIRRIGHLSRARISFHIDSTLAIPSCPRQHRSRYPTFRGAITEKVGYSRTDRRHSRTFQGAPNRTPADFLVRALKLLTRAPLPRDSLNTLRAAVRWP